RGVERRRPGMVPQERPGVRRDQEDLRAAGSPAPTSRSAPAYNGTTSAAASRRQASECWRHSSTSVIPSHPTSAATSADTASAMVLNVLPVMAGDGTAKLLTL